MTNLDNLFANVRTLYAGPVDKCCCGCSGTYTPVTDPKARKMFDRIMKDKNVKMEDTYAIVEGSTRMRIVYFK